MQNPSQFDKFPERIQTSSARWLEYSWKCVGLGILPHFLIIILIAYQFIHTFFRKLIAWTKHHPSLQGCPSFQPCSVDGVSGEPLLAQHEPHNDRIILLGFLIRRNASQRG